MKESEKLQKLIVDCIREHGGVSNIPKDHIYWGWNNRYSYLLSNKEFDFDDKQVEEKVEEKVEKPKEKIKEKK